MFWRPEDTIVFEYDAGFDKRPPLAVAVPANTDEIAHSLETKHGARVVMHHRIGDLAIGDVAVIVAAGAPHRDAAFLAAREAIDTLKTIVPIWKKEFAEDGAVWIEEHA